MNSPSTAVPIPTEEDWETILRLPELKDNKAYPYPYTSYDAWVAAGSPTPDQQYLMPYDYFRISLGYTTDIPSCSLPPALALDRPTFTFEPRLFRQRCLYTV